jgi:hypothetical protein
MSNKVIGLGMSFEIFVGGVLDEMKKKNKKRQITRRCVINANKKSG